MRNAKKTLSLVMVAIFTTFIVLSGIPAGAVTTAQAKAQVTKATAAVVKVENVVKVASFNPTTAQTLNTAATKEVAKVNKLGKTYKATYLKLVTRYQAVNKKITARKAAILAASKKVYTDAEAAVTAAENATDGDKVDLVGDETALANAQSAVTTALEMIVKLNQDSSDYKGLMARIDAANNLIVKAMDEIAEAAAQKAIDDKLKAEAEAAAKALEAAIKVAETDVAALEAAPVTTLAEIDAAVVLGTKAAASVKAIANAEKAAPFAARIKVVADKGLAVKAAIEAKIAAELEAKKPATMLTVSAVDGTLSLTFDKKAVTTPVAADFTVKKAVDGAAATAVTGVTVNVVSDTAVTLVVPATVKTTKDQSVVYSVAYTTGAAITASAYKVALDPALVAKEAAEAEAKIPATMVSVSAVDGTITVTFSKKPITTVAATSFVVTKTVTTTSAVTTTVVPTVNVVSDTAVTLTMATTAAIAVDQAISYSVVYNTTGAAITVSAGVVAKIPATTVTAVANNLKTAVLTFSKPVDDTTLTTTTVKAYLKASATEDVYTSSLSTDKTVLTIAYSAGAAMNQNDTVKLVLSGVKDSTGATIADFTTTLSVKDVSDPVAKSITVVNNKKIKVLFSEAVNMDTVNVFKTTDVASSGALVKIDGVVTFAKYTPVLADNSVTIEFFNAIADGAHTITISGAKDYTGFVAADATFSFQTAADVTAPVAVSAKYVSSTKVEVTFNEEVTATGTFSVYETGRAADLAVGGAATIVKATDAKTLVISLNPATAFTAASILGFDVKYASVKDTTGNASTSTAQTISGKTPDDAVKPTLVTTEVLTGNVIKVKFSEEVATPVVANFVLYKADGTTVVQTTATSIADFDTTTPDSMTYKVTFATLTSIDSATYVVKVTGIKDTSIRANAITDVTTSVVAKDSKAPTLSSAVLKPDTVTPFHNDKIELIFSEAMDTTFASNIANYFVGVGAVTTPLNTVTGASVSSVSADGKKVVLLIPDADNSPAGAFAGAVNRIATPGLKDVAGNSISNSTIAAPVTVLGAYVAMTNTDIKVEATGKNTIVVTALNGYTFSGALPGDFKIIKRATPGTIYDLGIIAAQVSTDATYVTLTTSVSLTGEAKYTDATPTDNLLDLYVANVTGSTKDMNGTVIAIANTSAVAVADKIVATQIAPVLGSATNLINVAFNEPVAKIATLSDATLATALTLKIGTTTLIPNVDYTASIVAVGGKNIVQVAVTKANVAAADVVVTLIHPEYLQDGNANAVTAIAAATVAGVSELVAPTAPTAVAVTAVGGTVVANTLNKTNTNMTATATITANEAVGGKAELYVGATKIATDSTIAADETSVTFTLGTASTAALQAAVTAGGTVTVKVYDLAGNVTTSAVANPTLVVDYTAPVAHATTAFAKTQATPGTYAAADTMTIKFSEPVLVANVTLANLVLSAHIYGVGSSIAATDAAGGYATTFQITLAGAPTVAAADTITISAANVVDAAGNTAAAPVVFTLN